MNQERWIEFLEDKTEATRYHLIGSGIVCGFQVSLGEKCSIHVTKGLGLTSCGHLISIPRDMTFRYYRAYRSDSGYPLFSQRKKGGKTVQVWELIPTHKEDPGNAQPLAPQTVEELRKGRFVDDKVLLLFMEQMASGVPPEKGMFTVAYFDYKDKTCSDIQRFRIRFLLMPQEDVLQILMVTDEYNAIAADKTDDLPPYGYGDVLYDRYKPSEDDVRKALQPALTLRELRLRRFPYVIVRTDCKPGEPDWVFPKIENLQQLFDAYKIIVDEAVTALGRELRKVQQHFHPILTHKGADYIAEHFSLLEKKWTTYRENAKGKGAMHYIQYFYDWMRDLYQAYNELRVELTELMAQCCANTGAYPRHLLIGKIKQGSTEYQPSPIRSHFRQPPIYNGNADRLVKVKMYHWRILMMIRAFYLPDYILDPGLNPHCAKNAPEEDIPKMSDIRITPSPFYDQPLGKQSIPYYYPLSSSRYSAHRFWSYQRSKTGAIDHILSYYAQASDSQEDNYSDIHFVIEPLIFNIDRFPFYRIEGHIGKNSQAVIAELTRLKQKYNLAFDIKVEKIANLTEEYRPAGASEHYGFNKKLLGIEHLAGVKENGTFVLITENDKVVADFSLPYRCCSDEAIPSRVSIDPVDALFERIGRASTAEKDDLTKINGIGATLEKRLNDAGIYTFEQISKLDAAKDAEIIKNMVAARTIKLEGWIREAETFKSQR